MRRERKRPAHLPIAEFGNLSPLVFVTACTARRKPILACPCAHSLLVAAWKKSEHWRVGRYVVMPDHVHLFCAPQGEGAVPLGNWIRFWKTLVSRRWSIAGEAPIWQEGFWDRQLRTGESYDQKWHYVRENPVRHGLVLRLEDWPYQGELTVLDWHDA